jgi:hypothetical protein
MSWANRKFVPASCAGLNPAQVEAELVKQYGNVTATARKLGVPPQDLRKAVWSSSLANTVYERVEQALDEAHQVLRDALKSGDQAQRLQAAKALLTQTSAGKRRGWGRGAATFDEPEPQPVTMKWLEH